MRPSLEAACAMPVYRDPWRNLDERVARSIESGMERPLARFRDRVVGAGLPRPHAPARLWEARAMVDYGGTAGPKTERKAEGEAERKRPRPRPKPKARRKPAAEGNRATRFRRRAGSPRASDGRRSASLFIERAKIDVGFVHEPDALAAVNALRSGVRLTTSGSIARLKRGDQSPHRAVRGRPARREG